ncbi:MAG: hypothetical protein COV84_02015 [Candidatus Portnoybacteria bacterium CG11_big_fil_rev_8_21_14_0_20_40_15]|uniref:Ada DNA repair metal-binding domain-containing protein n=2 Tax=Candidatus Portnoyibacteriota TaxID=1817913 RepID=A0A2M7YMW0_9BACT|nr:MAG: hypothetical protein COV84_02015 [Candidatus Portnoybacteria bacterium CG11_big_fil_rev_8_21_14_0_20_40_15]PJA64296.1 MAG: hypothetical protein CO159_03780 [Candidatus Portnoybacteria bacterium CG_4_9_14_3_um_filter_40_10]
MSTSENQNPVKLSWYGRAGDWAKKNQGDIALVLGFVFVALISFGIGYLTAPGVQKNPLIIEGPQTGISEQVASGQAGDAASASVLESATNAVDSGKGLIVASKNSKIYHWPWCSAAKNIKPENQVWFKSEAEAQATGRTRCADFEKLAPAGYIK